MYNLCHSENHKAVAPRLAPHRRYPSPLACLPSFNSVLAYRAVRATFVAAIWCGRAVVPQDHVQLRIGWALPSAMHLPLPSQPFL